MRLSPAEIGILWFCWQKRASFPLPTHCYLNIKTIQRDLADSIRQDIDLLKHSFLTKVPLDNTWAYTDDVARVTSFKIHINSVFASPRYQ